MLVDTVLIMNEKYNEKSQVFDSSFVGDAAQLALSSLGMIMSGKGALGSGKNLKKSLEKNADNTLDMNLQFFAGSKTSYGKSSGKYDTTADYLTNIENRNGKFYTDKVTIDQIGQIEARGEDFSLLNKKNMSFTCIC